MLCSFVQFWNAALPNAVEREVYAGRAAERAGLTPEAMLLDVKRARDRHQGRERRQMQREALNISALRQPQDRAIRYTDMRSAMAEEGILRLLLLDVSLADRCRDLAAEDFSSPFLGKVYRLLLEGRGPGRHVPDGAVGGVHGGGDEPPDHAAPEAGVAGQRGQVPAGLHTRYQGVRRQAAGGDPGRSPAGGAG